MTVSVRDLEQTVREGLRVPPRPCLDCTHDECVCERSKVLGGESLSEIVHRLEAAEGFAEWIVAMEEPLDVIGWRQRRTVTMTEIIGRARAALAAGAADTEGDET